MEEEAIVAIIVIAAVLLLLAGLAWWAATRRRRARLQDRFGPEYERTVSDADNKREAEAELRERMRRREELDIRPLPEPARARYSDRWSVVQERFVDAPVAAVEEADHLVTEVMRERGYPVDDFDQRAADVSVDHPDVVEHYRAGRQVAERSRTGDADTEELREAFVHYRALFEALLDERGNDDNEVVDLRQDAEDRSDRPVGYGRD